MKSAHQRCRPAHNNFGPTSRSFANASAWRSRAKQMARDDVGHTVPDRAAKTNRHRSCRGRKRPRSTVENTSRFSNTPSVHCADRTAASSFGKTHEGPRRRKRYAGCRQSIDRGRPSAPDADRLFLCNGFSLPRGAYRPDFCGRTGERRNSPEIDIIGWNERGPPSMVSSAAGDMAEQRSERCRRRRGASDPKWASDQRHKGL